MSKTYNPATVANKFLELAQEEGRQLTPMTLIKLSYIAHGWSLALLKRPLLKGRIEAWRYGPVIPDLYQRLKTFGRGPVTGKIPKTIFERDEALDADAERLVEEVYEKYGKLTGIQLSHLTHKTDSPWFSAYKTDENNLIPDETIQRHYESLSG